MIKADFFKTANGLRMSLQGHAGYREGGEDIVCAAVSGIFYALIGYLTNTKKEGLIIHSIGLGNGDVECSAEGEEAMKLAYIGLLQIAMTYPDNIAVLNRAFSWRTEPKVE